MPFCKLLGRLLASLLFFTAGPALATLHITNGDFEGAQFYTNPYSGNSSARDFFFWALYQADGDGWYNSANPDNYNVITGGPSSEGYYGAKSVASNVRSLVNVITDNRQTTGTVTLNLNVLYRANGGTESFLLKAWGVRASVAGQWDGWIDLTGPSGNANGLDLRNFNNALSPTNASQQSSTATPTYTGTNFTQLISLNAAALGLTPSDAWQPISFNPNLGATGYDQIIIGVAFGNTSGTQSGVDDLGLTPTLLSNFQLVATPATMAAGTNTITLTWGASNAPAGATWTITSDRSGFGPYNVTGQTVNGTNTAPLAILYNSGLGDITFTLTIHDPATSQDYATTTAVMVPSPEPNLVATPAVLSGTNQQISLTWTTTNFPNPASVVITANRVGFGPYDVAAMTSASGTSTHSLVIPYFQAIGNITFTLTVSNTANGVNGSSAATVSAPATNLPNVLIVVADDMGWSDISPYGGEIYTPTLARLASNGLRFREFHNEARCAPTRQALLSGLHVQTSATKPNNNLPAMRIDNNVTIAEMLRSVGYRTYLSGKWHLSEYAVQADYTPLSSPTHRGFDYAFNNSLWGGHLADGHSDGLYWESNLFELCPSNAEIAPIRYDGTDSRASRVPFFKTDADYDYALTYLNHHYSKQDGKPFFLLITDNAPHFYLSAPKDRINLYTDVADTNAADTDIYRYEVGWDITRSNRYVRQLAQGIIPPGTRLPPFSPNPGGPAIPTWDSLTPDQKNDQARAMATYAGMVHGIDQNLNRVVTYLDSIGQLTNTLILFFSDNGGNYEGGILGGRTPLTNSALAEMGQLGQAKINLGGAWANVNNTPFRYFKHHTHEGGDRTPLIVHWPAGIPPALDGKWTEERGHVIDVLPTILDIVGVNYPAQFGGHGVDPVQGISLLPALKGGALPARDLCIEHENNKALYRGDWKLLTKTFSYAAINELAANSVELYNLKNDPTEMDNLAFHKPQLVQEMISTWNNWVDSNVGLNANRKITPGSYETNAFLMPRGKEFLVDNFNRPNIDNLDADQTGISGTLIGTQAQPLNNLYYEGYNPANSQVVNERLRLTGAAENGLMINLDQPLVLSNGGFSVSFDITAINSPTTTSNDYVGFGVGLTQAAAQSGGDITSASSFRGEATQKLGQADCFVELDAQGKVKVWAHGQMIQAIPVGATQGWLVATFGITNSPFQSGDTVQLSVLFNAAPIYTGSFTWRQAGASYLGLSAKTGNYVEIDNLVLGPLPLRDLLVGRYGLAYGLTNPLFGPADSPAGDGVSTATKWMYGLNPTVNLAAQPPANVLTIRQDAPNGISLLHQRARAYAQAGVHYRLRYSSDVTLPMADWAVLTEDQASAVVASSTYEQVRVTLPAEMQTAPQFYFVLDLEND